MFGWPSGLGSRLQNEIGRFDSDSKLKKKMYLWCNGSINGSNPFGQSSNL